MPAALIPEDESARLQSLYSYSILDTPPEQEFDELTQIAAQLCETPIALISLIDSGRSWYKSQHGMNDPGSPRSIALCAHAILSDQLTEVPDTTRDPRFLDNPAVIDDPNLRFYAGAPLCTPDNHRIGTLCVLDFQPRKLNDNQRSGLETLSRLIMMQMDLRRARIALKDNEGSLRSHQENLRDILENSSDLIQSVGRDGRILFVNNAWTKAVGYATPKVCEMNIFDIIAEDHHEHCREFMTRLFSGEDPGPLKTCFVGDDGRRIHVEGSVNLQHHQNIPMATRSILRDVTDQRATELLRAARVRVLDRLSASASLTAIFQSLVDHIAEFWPHRSLKLEIQHHPDQPATVVAAGPPEPQDKVGSSKWSEPIINEKGIRIGAFQTYQKERCVPSPIDRRILEECAGLAAMVLERKQTTTALEVLVENLEHIVSDRTRDLRESERFVRAVLNALPEHIAVLDETATIIATNYESGDSDPGLETLRLGLDYLAHCENSERSEDFACRLTARHIRSILSGEKTEASFEYCDENESEARWYLCRLTLFPGDGPRRIIVSHEDISARKDAELDALQSKQRFQSFFEFAPDACIIAGTDGQIWLANQQAEELFQYDRSVLQNMSISELLPKTQKDGEGEPAMISTGNPVTIYEPVGRRRDGSTFPAEINFSPLDFEDGAWTAASIRDMTFRQEQEQRTLRMQRLESIGTLAGGIAHDLNNALAPVLMSTAMLRSKYPGDLDIVETIETSTKRGAHMIRQLLTFARGVEGEEALVDPVRIHDEIANIIANTFPKNIRMRKTHQKQPGFVLGDATQLHQVLLNLCVNARDAMPEGGQLNLELEATQLNVAQANQIPGARAGSFIVWRVGDSGDGISPEILDRIFEPFFTTKAIDRGTGLGLSTVLGIVNSHDGFVQVHSTPGEGSVFEVYLPMQGNAESQKDLNTTLESDFYGQAETILIVDDEPQVRAVTKAVLQSLNFSVLCAADGREALECIKSNRRRIRTLISDVHMPEMDGIELIRNMRNEGIRIPVVLASGRFEEPELSRARELGVSAFLEKPYTQEQLASALDQRPSTV